jgi:organic hydroperoxide reductase OsmC/OhrA
MTARASSEHVVTIGWARVEPARVGNGDYSRDHRWSFGTGTSIEASAAVEYGGNPTLPNPEEALVGAIASCHMLTFLAICARKGVVVERYDDHAVGILERNPEGRIAVSRVTLRPKIAFGEGTAVDDDALDALHAQAHRGCFIASSVKTEITIERA